MHMGRSVTHAEGVGEFGPTDSHRVVDVPVTAAFVK